MLGVEREGEGGQVERKELNKLISNIQEFNWIKNFFGENCSRCFTDSMHMCTI